MMTPLTRNAGRMARLVWCQASLAKERFPELRCKARINRAVASIWFAWVGVLSLLPAGMKADLHTRGDFHIPAHAVVFAVSAFIACRSVKGTLWRVMPCVVVIGYGGVLETLQFLISRSQFEWDDLATDAGGVVVAFLFTTWMDAMRKARQTAPG